MSTKVIVIGEANETVSQKKPIKLISSWCHPREIGFDLGTNPCEYNYVELVAKDYFTEFDLIFCYNNPNRRGNGCLFIGHWNDGVVQKFN